MLGAGTYVTGTGGWRSAAAEEEYYRLQITQLSSADGVLLADAIYVQVVNVKTDKFVLVKGTEDSVVWPREGEWFGAMDPADPWGTVLPMNQTAWYALEAPTPRPSLSLSVTELSLPPHLLLARPHRYLEDKFGLRTADEAGKIFFESFDGDHLQFTTAELEGWLDKYFST